jgi:hypothetical protein
MEIQKENKMKKDKPSHTTVSKTWHHVPAKKLSKGDNVNIGARSLRVKSVVKDDNKNKRIVVLGWGTKRKKDEVLLHVHKNFPFNVRVHECL